MNAPDCPLDADGYPTEETLEYIRKYDVLLKGAKPLLELLREVWWASDWGFVRKNGSTINLALHTGGWSGNEEIVGALRVSWFWKFYWQESRRGGHYKFEFPRKFLLPTQQTAMATLADSGEFMDRNCPNCKTVTKQEVKLYNPDNGEDGEVWECTKCKENTGRAD